MASSRGARTKTSDDIHAVLAGNVAFHRKRLGLSQEGLSKLCRLHYSYAGRLERGSENPRLSTIKQIADALEVTVAALLTPPGKKKR